MNQLGLLFDQTEEAPKTPADTTPTRTVTGLAEIKSETPPIDICSMESCKDRATRWVVFDHATVFTAFCSEHAPVNRWWTPDSD